MTHRSATLHRLVALPLAVLVGMEAAATGQAEDLQPGSPVWQQFILEHTDEARRLREAGEYGRAVSFLTRAAEEAQRARPETSTSNDRWYLNLAASEAQQLVAALAQALDRALDQLQSDSLTWRAAWLADPSVDRALQQARALRQSVPERADELVGDLRVAIRAYLGALYGEPIRPYRSARAQSELASSIDAVVREVEEACRSSSPTAARISLTRGLRLAESMEIVDARRAASEWNRLVTTTGEDVELAGLRPSELRQLVEACEQQLALWEEGFATLDGGGAQRLQEAVRAAQGVVLDHARVLGTIEELERSYRSARETWRGLDPEAATATPPPTWTDRALDEAAEVREETIRLEQLLRETAEDGSVRTVLLDIKAWIEFIRGPEMLGRIDPFIADANEAAADIQRQLRRLDDEIERGRRCLADGEGDPSNPSAQVSGPGPPASVHELQATPTPTTASPSVPPPAPAPTATPLAPTQPVDPDVAGGLKITGPARIGVGWGVSLSATDHGGRPVSEVSWHAMADNIRVEGDGTVVGLRPGRATVMATAHGMRAFFDFNVVADDGAPGTPGGPPALATPMPDVVVVPPSQPTPTPTPASLPPSDGRTTDWAEPTPTPWFVPQESDPGTGEAGAEPADDGAGGGFEDLGTEVVRGSGTSAPPSRDGGAPSIPIGPAGAAVAGVDNFRLPPDTPTSDGGFEDLGTEIGRPDAEAQPDRADPPAREAQSAGAVVLPPTGPQQPEVAGEAGGSTETEAAATAADDGSAGSSEPTEGLTFLGETAGSAAAPSVDGPLVLLPPPGEGSPGPEGGPPSPGSPPGGPAPPPPGDGGGPFIPSRASVNGAGQPAAYHIFATCSRLSAIPTRLCPCWVTVTMRPSASTQPPSRLPSDGGG
jgi:hypothetical protein